MPKKHPPPDKGKGYVKYICFCNAAKSNGEVCVCTDDVWTLPGIDPQKIRCWRCASGKHKWG